MSKKLLALLSFSFYHHENVVDVIFLGFLFCLHFFFVFYFFCCSALYLLAGLFRTTGAVLFMKFILYYSFKNYYGPINSNTTWTNFSCSLTGVRRRKVGDKFSDSLNFLLHIKGVITVTQELLRKEFYFWKRIFAKKIQEV